MARSSHSKASMFVIGLYTPQQHTTGISQDNLYEHVRVEVYNYVLFFFLLQEGFSSLIN